MSPLLNIPQNIVFVNVAETVTGLFTQDYSQAMLLLLHCFITQKLRSQQSIVNMRAEIFTANHFIKARFLQNMHRLFVDMG